MQHSGAPTRLLDWTEGALIALYFAVRDKREQSDAAVWVIDPWLLNKRVVGEREVIAPGAESGLFTADASRYKPWLPDRFASQELPDFPVAVYPTHTARRISSQRSCFTIHGANALGFERLSDESGFRLLKIVIPGSAVGSIEHDLAIAGVDEVTIFPDLDGLGRFLNTVLLDESDRTKIEFRRVVLPDELDALLELDKIIFKDFQGDLFTREEWEEFESYWMLAEGKVIGCSAFLRDVDYDETPRPGCLYIVTTGILPQFRGRGFGDKQKQWQMEFAKQQGFGVVVTNTRQSNSRIISLNLKSGFKIRGFHPDFYNDPKEGAIVMEKLLA